MAVCCQVPICPKSVLCNLDMQFRSDLTMTSLG